MYRRYTKPPRPCVYVFKFVLCAYIYIYSYIYTTCIYTCVCVCVCVCVGACVCVCFVHIHTYDIFEETYTHTVQSFPTWKNIPQPPPGATHFRAHWRAESRRAAAEGRGATV